MENRSSDDDNRNIYNPNKYNDEAWSYVQRFRRPYFAQINPAHPEGLVPPPKDWQYEMPSVMRKSLIPEQMHDEDDFMNFYNPNKKENPGRTYNMQVRDEDITRVNAHLMDETPGRYSTPLTMDRANDTHDFKIPNTGVMNNAQVDDINRPNAHLMDETPGRWHTPLTSDRMNDTHDFRIPPKNVANNGSI